MKKLIIAFVICVVPLLVNAAPNGGSFVNGVWEHSHDHADWDFNEDGRPSPGYNEASGYIIVENQTPVDGHYGEILGDANNPLSPGRAGIRYWVGNSANNIGTVTPNLGSFGPYRELWMRYYVRFQQGYRWPNGYFKLFRVETVGTYTNIFAQLLWENTIQITTEGAATAYRYPTPDTKKNDSKGWTTTFSDDGGVTSHGRWVCIETYTKMESSVGDDDGVLRLWVNGELVAEKTDMQFVDPSGTSPSTSITGWNRFFGGNQTAPLNAPVTRYVDYDDIALYSVTPSNRDAANNPMIGPLNFTLHRGGKMSGGGAISSGGYMR